MATCFNPWVHSGRDHADGVP
ncbi:hypothetical protein PMI12_02864, partial [Variovorax sp. CF313]